MPASSYTERMPNGITVMGPVNFQFSNTTTISPELQVNVPLVSIFQEFQDLNCVVCRRIESSAKNRLIECTDCQSLYHQECHNPQISESDANENDSTWCCTHCKNKVKSSSVASPAKSSCSTSSSSSSSYQKHVSSKSFEPSVPPVTSKSSKSSSKHKSSSSKHSSKTNSSNQSVGIVSPSVANGSGTSSLTKAPVTINIISADKRLQNMKKKAAKMQETRRKHKQLRLDQYTSCNSLVSTFNSFYTNIVRVC